MAEYSASGLYIITFASFSGELKVWDATTYEEIFKIQEQFSLDKYIIKLAFDDKQIVMANIDSSSVRVWDIKTAEEDVINDPFKLIIPDSADEDEKEIYKKIEKLIRGTNAQDGTPFKFSSNLKTCFITLNDNYLILKDSNNELYIFTRTLENVISKY